MLRVSGRDARACAAAVAALGALFLASKPAFADPETIEAARYVYTRGAAEYDRGDFASAAVDFANADELVPNPVTLTTAIDAALKADAVALGMELIERSKRGALPPALARAIADARVKFTARAGRIVIHCAAPCHLTLDGKPTSAEAAHWVISGDHSITIEVNGATQQRTVAARVGETVEVGAEPRQSPTEAPAPTPAPVLAPAVAVTPAPLPLHDKKGISPAWFVVGAGATGVAGVVTIVFALETKSAHDTFEANKSDANSSAGMDAQLRTNVMIGVTAGLAVATAAVGVFAVRWSSANTHREASMALTGNGLLAGVRF